MGKFYYFTISPAMNSINKVCFAIEFLWSLNSPEFIGKNPIFEHSCIRSWLAGGAVAIACHREPLPTWNQLHVIGRSSCWALCICLSHQLRLTLSKMVCIYVNVKTIFISFAQFLLNRWTAKTHIYMRLP